MDKELEQIIDREAQRYQDSIVKQNPAAEAYDFFNAFIAGAHFVLDTQKEIDYSEKKMWDMVPYDDPEHDFKVHKLAVEYTRLIHEKISTDSSQNTILDTDDLDKIFNKGNETD